MPISDSTGTPSAHPAEAGGPAAAVQAHDEAAAHALLLQLQQLITDLQQPLEHVLAQAAQAACAITGAVGAMIALRENDALAVRASVGALPLPAIGTRVPLDACASWQGMEQAARAGL